MILIASIGGSVAFGLLMLLIAYSWRLSLWGLGATILVMALWDNVDVHKSAPLPKSKKEFFTELFGIAFLLGISLLLGYGMERLLVWPAEYFEITLLKGLIFIFFSVLYFAFTDDERLWTNAKGTVVGLLIYLGCCTAEYFALSNILPLILQ